MNGWVMLLMTARLIVGIIILVPVLSQMARADQTQEDLSVDFLEFLADMNEVTGEGFDNWLDDNSEDGLVDELNHTKDTNHQSSFKDKQYSEQIINE